MCKYKVLVFQVIQSHVLTNKLLFIRLPRFSVFIYILILSVSIHMCFVMCIRENLSVLLLLHCQTVCAEYQKSAVERDISIRPDTLDTVTEVVTQDSSIALEQSEKSKIEE